MSISHASLDLACFRASGLDSSVAGNDKPAASVLERSNGGGALVVVHLFGVIGRIPKDFVVNTILSLMEWSRVFIVF
jgi:hypothetical protein